MSKRSSYQIKKEIMKKVKEKAATYAELERKLSTGYRTIKANCEELFKYELIEVKSINKHSANGRPFHLVKITGKGLKTLKNK